MEFTTHLFGLWMIIREDSGPCHLIFQQTLRAAQTTHDNPGLLIIIESPWLDTGTIVKSGWTDFDLIIKNYILITGVRRKANLVF